MDDRRRTISSEQDMIGEALMRVSNTLEAERLTKSLDYQEKLRSRSNIRLIISIICLVVALAMVLIGGLLLVILVKYEDPVLDTLVPFLKSFFNGMNTIFQSAVESSTYLPALTRLGTEALGIGVAALQGLSNMDLSGVMGYLTNILGSTAGMLDTTNSLLAGLSGTASSMVGDLTNSLSGVLNSGISGTLSDLGINTGDLATINKSLIGTLANVSSSIASPEAQATMSSIGDATASLATNSADLLNSLNTATAAFNNNVDYAQLGQTVGTLADAAGKTANAGATVANSTADFLNSAANALSSLAGTLN